MILESIHACGSEVKSALPRLIAFRDASASETDLNMPQRISWFSLALHFKPEVIIELGRGYGNSTTVFTEAAQRLKNLKVFSICRTDYWSKTIVPQIAAIVPKHWFQPLTVFQKDITRFDFSPVVEGKGSVLLLWDAHGFEVAERVLTHILPLISQKRHLVLCHDIADNRFQGPKRRSYSGKRLWRGMAHKDTGYVNLGWCNSRVDQIIPILDFCFRNGIELHSADYDFAKAAEQAPEKLAEIKNVLGTDMDYLKQRFQFAYFSLNETSPPFHFPSPTASVPTKSVQHGLSGWLSKMFLRREPD